MSALLLLSLLVAPLAADAAVSKLTDSNWRVRSEGFNAVMNIPAKSRTDAAHLGLIAALNCENTLVKGGAILDEGFSEYYASLIQAVASMKDPRSVKALLGALATGRMAADGLVALREPAVDETTAKLASTKSPSERRDLCSLLRRMLEPSVALQGLARKKIEKGIVACGKS